MNTFLILVVLIDSWVYNMSKYKLYTLNMCSILFINCFSREKFLKKGTKAPWICGQFLGQGGWEQIPETYLISKCGSRSPQNSGVGYLTDVL